ASELILDGQTGTLVPVKSPPALADAIGRLLSDPASAKAMGAAGRARVAAEFSWERMVAQYEQLYESLMDGATLTSIDPKRGRSSLSPSVPARRPRPCI